MEVCQEIEFCLTRATSTEMIQRWLPKFSWVTRTRLIWDTWRESVLTPPMDERPWTADEVAQMLRDLRDDPEVSYAIEAGKADST